MISDVDHQSDVHAADEEAHYRTKAVRELTVEEGWLGFHRHDPEVRNA